MVNLEFAEEKKDSLSADRNEFIFLDGSIFYIANSLLREGLGLSMHVQESNLCMAEIIVIRSTVLFEIVGLKV